MSRVTQNTLLIQVDTEEYPLTLDMVRNRMGNISFSAEPPLADIEAMGYAEVVTVGGIPTGDVVTEGKPALVNGVWQRTWNVRDYSESETNEQLTAAKTSAVAAVMTLRHQDLEVGFLYVTPGVIPFHVQLRVEDRINLLTLNLQGQAYVAQESTATVPFRGYENFTVQLTGWQLVEMTNQALVAMSQVYQLSWDLKDQIEAATTMAELPELPETLLS